VVRPSGDPVSYTRDLNGNLLSLKSPAATTTYQYDALNRLTQVNGPDGNAFYYYDLAGNRTRFTAANGIVTDYVYDLRNRPTLISHQKLGLGALQSFSNSFSLAGRRTGVTEIDGSQESYAFDTRGRLASEVRTGVAPFSSSYVYDAVGNRTQMVQNGVSTSLGYDSDDKLLTAGSATYGYDANGNLVSKSVGGITTSYGYDTLDRLMTVSGPGGTTQYAYDADGNRIQAVTPAGTTRYLVDGMNPTGLVQVLEEKDGTGALKASYAYGDELLSMARGGFSAFYHRDAQGSTRGLTSATGAVTDTYQFDAHGRTVASTGTTDNPYLYGGQRFDSGTGLFQLRARYYDPALGRFLSRDRAEGQPESPASFHPYAYANGDPIDHSDPSGLETLSELTVAEALDASFDALYSLNRVRTVCSLTQRLDVAGNMALIAQLAITAAGSALVDDLAARAFTGGPAGKSSGKIAFTAFGTNPFRLGGASVKSVEFRLEVPLNVVGNVAFASGGEFKISAQGLAGGGPLAQWGISACGVVSIAKVALKMTVKTPFEALGAAVFGGFKSGDKLGSVSLSGQLQLLSVFRFELTIWEGAVTTKGFKMGLGGV
jgi:RHS repeat-associated protein